MKKLLTCVSLLLFTISCSSNKPLLETASKTPEVEKANFYFNSQQLMSRQASINKQANLVKENNTGEAKPVVLKRTMHRPTLI